MNQQLSTYFTAIQTERENRDLALLEGWTAATALEENDKSKVLKTLIRVSATALVGIAGTIASLVR
jgi:hypothetical protein